MTDTVVAAAIAAVASVTAALISYRVKRDQDTGNGHTIGRAAARLEDRMQDHEQRLDRIEVRLVEDLGQIKERLSHAVFDQERHLSTYKHDRRLVDE